MRKKLALLILALGISLPVLGQTFGEITGTVTDPSGAVVAGAVITVTNVATHQTRAVHSNQAGNYTVPFLVPGIYDIQAEISGFKRAERKGLTLQVSDVARVDFALEVGEMTQAVEVTGAAALLSTESTATGTVIENKRIVELPINGRTFLDLVKLSPNVSAEMGAGGQNNDRQGGERANQPISIAGQRMQYNHYTLDGVENTDVNFNTFIIRPSIDALQEFKVQSGVYPAEFGRATSQVNATTKSGANEYHGTAYEFLRNDKLDAKEWNLAPGTQKNPFRRNQFGFTLGGPISVPGIFKGKDRLFFLSNFEELRDRKTLQGKTSVATDRMRAGDFGGQTRNIFDPASRVFRTDAQGNDLAISATPFSSNVIPQTRFNSVAQKLSVFYPRATIPGDSILNNFVRQRPRPIDWEQFLQRIDWTESAKSSWFGRFSWGDEFVKRLANFEEQEGRTTTKVYQAMISNIRTFGAATVNEFRFGYNQFQNDQLLHFAYQRDVTSELKIPGLTSPVTAAWGTPSLPLSNGLAGFGESDEGPYVNRNHTFQFMDNLSVVRGKHSFKFGGEIRRDRYNQIGNQFPRGSFIFEAAATRDPANRNTTGHSFADFLLGESRRSERALGIANTMFRATAFYLYFDDTWKLTPKMTLSLGLRYENTAPFHDKYRGIMNVQLFDPGVGPNGLLPNTKVPIFTRPCCGDVHQGIGYHFHDAIPKQVGDEFLGRALVGKDNNDFAPRIGLAYTPTARWSFRTAFGVFYTQDTGNPVFDMGRNLGGRDRFESNDERPNSNLNDPWAFERQAFKCSNWSGPCLGPPYTLGNIHDRRTPYIMQWLFNVQRQLSDTILLELGYQGNQGHKLQRLRAYNEAVPRTGPSDARDIFQRSPWPAYGRIQEVDNSVNSNYHALDVKLQQRFSRGVTYLIGYTWSKAIDNGSAIRTNDGDRLFPPNSYDLASERGLSQFHTGRRFVGSVIYELPLGLGKPFLNHPGVVNKVVGGWQISSIVTFSDGTPINVGGIGDTLGISTDNWPDATGISPIPSDRSASRFWNVAAFNPGNPQLSYRYGTVGRNVLFRPGVRQWDFSLVKNTNFTERHNLQFRFEAFNFSNHPNWNPPSTDSKSSTFGIVTSARTMRELQFGLKYSF